MSISSQTLRKLSSLSLSAEQMAGVLEILADNLQAEEERLEAQAERKRLSRDRHRTVTGQSQDKVVTDAKITSPLNSPPNGFPHPSLTPPIIPPSPKPKRARSTVTLDELAVDHIADWLAKKRSEGRYVNHDEHFVLEKLKNHCLSNGKKYDDYTAAYRNAFDWDSCQPVKTTGRSNFQPQQTKDERAKAASMRAAQALGIA